MTHMIALLTLSIALVAGGQSPPAATATQPMRVLFLCPHGAAKSVLASTYFRRRAEERGLRVRVDAAGTEPDAQVSPAVADLLRSKGYDPPAATPRKVTTDDLAGADLVISLGCDLKAFPVKPGTLRQWDVPGPSENLTASDAAIREKVDALVEELLAAARQR
jgi:protein-tyrosine-phosphatase